MDRSELIKRLLATFLAELEEHAGALEQGLLSLERASEEDRAGLLASLFRSAHSLKGAAQAVDAGPIAAACHAAEGLLSAARDGSAPLDLERIRHLLQMCDGLREAAGRLERKEPLTGGLLDHLLPRLAPTAARSPSPAPAPTEEPHVAPQGRDGWVRVHATKLDRLLVSSTELLVVRSRAAARYSDLDELRSLIGQASSGLGTVSAGLETSGVKSPPSLRRARSARANLARAQRTLKRLEHAVERLGGALRTDQELLQKAARSLEDEVKRVRMLPFAGACEGLGRVVHDLSAASGKNAELLVEGGAVELDRSIIEGLRDPLLHLVRNAVHHGLELPEERQRAGKSPRGRVVVSAALRGERVHVAVTDDGRGIDLDAVREQAALRGLDVPADDAALARLVLVPGLSTAGSVTDVSGRGVGLDVVRDTVESMHGGISIASMSGGGVRFTLQLPMTLATVRALLVRSGGHVIAIPSAAVDRLLRVGADDLRVLGTRDVLLLDEVPVPVVSLARVLDPTAAEEAPTGGRVPVVVVGAANSRLALTVSDLLAEQEVVVRRLGPRLAHLRHFSGATVLASGDVALIASTQDLVRSALSQPVVPVVVLAAAKGPGARVLVVDDSATTRTLVEGVLESAGYHVSTAHDGAEAWRVLREHGVDLVVADVEMPRMDGFALTAAIRSSPRHRETPVVLVSALETDEARARGLAAGADAYLGKRRFDQQALLETVARLLSGRAS